MLNPFNVVKKGYNSLTNAYGNYQNSSSLKEFVASYLISLDDIKKRLSQAKTDKERISILTEGLENANGEIQRLLEENARLKEQLKDKEEAESAVSTSNLEKITKSVKSLSETVDEAKTFLIEVDAKLKNGIYDR